MTQSMEHPGLLNENTRVFWIRTPGSFALEDPGVFGLNQLYHKYQQTRSHNYILFAPKHTTYNWIINQNSQSKSGRDTA